MRTLASCSDNPAITITQGSANWDAVAATWLREFSDGDLLWDSDCVPQGNLAKALGFPLSLMQLTLRTPLTYRRSWQHIRNNKVGLKLLWFVRRGSVEIVRSQGTCTVAAGSAAILDSNAPFHAKILCEEGAVHESIQLIVPPDLFVTHLSAVENFTGAFTLDTSAGDVAHSLLNLLAAKGEQLSRKTASSLSTLLLDAIGENIGLRHVTLPRRQRLADRRLADIEEYIEMHLTDPDLSYTKVAESCGISPRYLCYILKANGRSFSDFLWSNRLPKARDLLLSSATRNYSIREVAFMSGFKSAAHFSRQFKATYGRPPREYRAANGFSIA